MCAIYIFAVVTAVHPFDIVTLQTLEIFVLSIRSWSLCRIMRQDRSNWGQARAVQKKQNLMKTDFSANMPPTKLHTELATMLCREWN